jgi:hypothetical protein
MYCPIIIFPLFPSIWQIKDFWSIIDPLYRNPNWWSPIILSMYGVNLQKRILDKTDYVVGNSDVPLLLLKWVLPPFSWIYTITVSFHCSVYSTLFETESKSLWISERNVLRPAWISPAVMWSVPANLYLVRYNGSAVWISVCLTSLTPCTSNSRQEEVILPYN